MHNIKNFLIGSILGFGSATIIARIRGLNVMPYPELRGVECTCGKGTHQSVHLMSCDIWARVLEHRLTKS